MGSSSLSESSVLAQVVSPNFLNSIYPPYGRKGSVCNGGTCVGCQECSRIVSVENHVTSTDLVFGQEAFSLDFRSGLGS